MFKTKNMIKDLKLFFRFIIPSMLGMLITGIYNVVDTFFLGRELGYEILASVAITWPLLLLTTALGDTIGTGSAIVVAQKKGAGKLIVAQKAIGAMLSLELTIGILFTIFIQISLPFILSILRVAPEHLSYSLIYARIYFIGTVVNMLAFGCAAIIRNDHRPNWSMAVIFIGIFSNILLDYLFIVILKFGIVGAASATVIAQSISFLCALPYFFLKDTIFSRSWKTICFPIKLCKQIILNGISSLGVHIAFIAMYLMHNYQSQTYGGAAGLASYTVVSMIESFGYLLLTGVANGTQALIGFFHGAREHLRKNKIAFMGIAFSFLFGSFLTLFMIYQSMYLVDAFKMPEIREMASNGLIISCTTFLLVGVIKVGICYFQSVNKLKSASALVGIDAIIVLPICLIVLPMLWGINGVWASMPISRVIMFVIFLILIKSKK